MTTLSDGSEEAGGGIGLHRSCSLIRGRNKKEEKKVVKYTCLI